MSDLQSTSALFSFLDDNQLTDNFGLTRFEAQLQFVVNEKSDWLDVIVQVERNGFNGGQVNVISDVPAKYPARFSPSFDQFSFKGGKVLKITGDYQHSGLGKYIAYLFVI